VLFEDEDDYDETDNGRRTSGSRLRSPEMADGEELNDAKDVVGTWDRPVISNRSSSPNRK